MTFEEFQATRKECADLAKAVESAPWDENVTGGFTYHPDELSVLYIEDTATWAQCAAKPARYYLLIGRADWFSDELEPLERRLYEFAVGEGYFDETREGLTAEYGEWLKANNLPSMSAEELIFEPQVTREQSKWLAAFSERWERMERRDDARH